jgi:hypothetical protein
MTSRKATGILTPRNRVLLEKLIGHKLVKKFPRILRNPKVHYSIHKRPPPLLVLNQINTVHFSSSHFLKIPFNVKFHLGLCLPNGLPQSPHHNPVYILSVSHARNILSPSHSSRFVHSNNIWWAVQITKLLVMLSSKISCCLLQSPVVFYNLLLSLNS